MAVDDNVSIFVTLSMIASFRDLNVIVTVSYTLGGYLSYFEDCGNELSMLSYRSEGFAFGSRSIMKGIFAYDSFIHELQRYSF